MVRAGRGRTACRRCAGGGGGADGAGGGVFGAGRRRSGVGEDDGGRVDPFCFANLLVFERGGNDGDFLFLFEAVEFLRSYRQP